MRINDMYNEAINNPITGETLYILESNEDVFRIEFEIEPRSSIAAEHVHPYQQQTIYVVEGALGCRIDGKKRVLGVGESVTIPAGVSHSQWNPTNRHARAIEEIRPAGRIHTMFRVGFALASEGKTNAKGVPKPLIGAAFVSEFKDVVHPTSLGLRLMFGALGPLSRLLGYRQAIREYIERFEQEDLDRTPVIPFVDKSVAHPEYSTSIGSLTTERIRS